MRNTKYGIARTGYCRVGGELLASANEDPTKPQEAAPCGPDLEAMQQQLRREEADRIAGMNWPAIPDLPAPDTGLVKGWTDLGPSDLDLAGPGPAPGTPGSSLPACPHHQGLACTRCYPVRF